MKRHFVLVIILILLGLFIAFSAAAHPYDSPLTFRKHLTDDGRVIYSNIPKKCFSNGYLTCQQLHPIYGMPVAIKKAASSSTKRTSVTQGKKLPEDLSAPQSGCNIKGNISSEGELIYHIPSGASYNATEIIEEDGESWFCSEEEAKAAGWRAARN